jgi:hypothetical protein
MRASIFISRNGVDPVVQSGQWDSVKRNPMLSIIHAAICSGPVFFLIVSYFVGPKNAPQSFLAQIGWIFGAGSAAASFFIPRLLAGGKEEINAGSEPSDSQGNLNFVQKIVQWAIVEAGALFNGVVYFSTGDSGSAAVSVAMILLLIYFRPTASD